MTHCPLCGTKLIAEWDVLEGTYIDCPNPSCNFRTPNTYESTSGNINPFGDYGIQEAHG